MKSLHTVFTTLHELGSTVQFKSETCFVLLTFKSVACLKLKIQVLNLVGAQMLLKNPLLTFYKNEDFKKLNRYIIFKKLFRFKFQIKGENLVF